MVIKERGILFSATLIVFYISLVSSLSVDIPIPLNLNGTNWTMNVNNTDCWLGHCTSDGSWLTGISTYNSSYVPYTGATGNVDLVTKNLTAREIIGNLYGRFGTTLSNSYGNLLGTDVMWQWDSGDNRWESIEDFGTSGTMFANGLTDRVATISGGSGTGFIDLTGSGTAQFGNVEALGNVEVGPSGSYYAGTNSFYHGTYGWTFDDDISNWGNTNYWDWTSTGNFVTNGSGTFGNISARNVCYSNGTGCNSSLTSTYNQTYQTWAYNQTTPAISYLVSNTSVMRFKDYINRRNPFYQDSTDLASRYLLDADTTNTLHNAEKRFNVSISGFSTNPSSVNMFNGQWEDTNNEIKSGDIANVYINFSDTKSGSELGFYFPDGLVYPAGYFYLDFYARFCPLNASANASYKNNGIIPLSCSNVATRCTYRCEVTSNYAYLQGVNFTIVGNGTYSGYNASLTEIEYHLIRPSYSQATYISKYRDDYFYNQLIFKNTSNSDTVILDAGTGNINVTGVFINKNRSGLTGNYTNGNCWTAYSGGIMYATNCTSI
jgi:hypothetical protein